MINYFSKIEIRYDKKERTTLSLDELLRDVDCAKFEIQSGIEDDYSNRKIIQHHDPILRRQNFKKLLMNIRCMGESTTQFRYICPISLH